MIVEVDSSTDLNLDIVSDREARIQYSKIEGVIGVRCWLSAAFNGVTVLRPVRSGKQALDTVPLQGGASSPEAGVRHRASG